MVLEAVGERASEALRQIFEGTGLHFVLLVAATDVDLRPEAITMNVYRTMHTETAVALLRHVITAGGLEPDGADSEESRC
jgi:hypothetical protein